MELVKSKYKNSIWFHLLLMLIVAAVFYIIFFSSLSSITSHGQELKIPVLIDKNYKDAIKILEEQGFEMEIDSSYDMKKPFGVVLSQIPDTGQFVKRGRTVFLIINKMQAPLIAMPDLTGVSYRSAQVVLRSSKLKLGDTIHRPDIADGAILEAQYDGKVVQAGDMIPEGSKIVLVIGDGLGNVEFSVPNVVGMAYPEAIAILNASGLQFIDVWQGKITDSQTAIVHSQFPEALNEYGGANSIKEGQLIDIKIRQTFEADNQQPAPDNKRQKKRVDNNSNTNNGGDWN